MLNGQPFCTFKADGTWSQGARGQTSSSGYGGSYAGQNDSRNGGQWKIQNGQLYMSNPPDTPALMPVELRVTANSNGYPILHADGKEYSLCR